MDDASRYGRGGLLPMSVFLTQNAPGLRTSPVKRGYWVVRRVLGEMIPPPPPIVPELPQDEAKLDLPLRDMLAKHRENPSCAACHARFDSFGLAFEGYGPVGESAIQRPCRPAGGYPGGFPGGRRDPGSRVCKRSSASIGRTISWITSAANCSPTRLDRSLHAFRRTHFERMTATLRRKWLSLQLLGGDDRHKSAVPEQTNAQNLQNDQVSTER